MDDYTEKTAERALPQSNKADYPTSQTQKKSDRDMMIDSLTRELQKLEKMQKQI